MRLITEVLKKDSIVPKVVGLSAIIGVSLVDGIIQPPKLPFPVLVVWVGWGAGLVLQDHINF